MSSIHNAQIWRAHGDTLEGQMTVRGVTYVCRKVDNQWRLTEAQVRGYRVPIVGLLPKEDVRRALDAQLSIFLEREQERHVIYKETINEQPKGKG